MEKIDKIEPGLLKILRFFALVACLGATLYGVLSAALSHPVPGESAALISFLVIDYALLSVYLSLSWLRGRLKGLYLPIALVSAYAVPLAVLVVAALSRATLLPVLPMQLEWANFLMFAFLNIITAWQYPLWVVLPIIMVSSVFEPVASFLLAPNGAVELPSLLFSSFLRLAALLLMSYFITFLIKNQRNQRQQLIEANARLREMARSLGRLAETRERNRLARELHDTLAHTLSGLAVHLEAMHTLMPSNGGEKQSVDRMVAQALDMTRSGLNETRNALRDLRLTPLEDLGMRLALKELASDIMEQNAGLTIHLDLSDGFDDLPPHVEHAVYRIVQEALRNVVLHAAAGRVTISGREEHNSGAVSICDDGCGFDRRQWQTDEHFGIRGMVERAEAIGGTLELESEPNAGTRVNLTWSEQP